MEFSDRDDAVFVVAPGQGMHRGAAVEDLHGIAKIEAALIYGSEPLGCVPLEHETM